ncbi:MAG TPA: hypothetical protein VGN88_04560, partial [Phycisphaerae bacterium]
MNWRNTFLALPLGGAVIATAFCATPFPMPHADTLPATAPLTTRPPATSPAAIDPSWMDMIKALGDDDFSRRQAAQEQLDKTTWRDLEILHRLTDSAADAEVKARLSARMETIKDELAVNPPTLTLDFKEIPFFEVGEKLSQQMGITIDTSANGPRINDLFSIHAVDKPFWEVFMALSRQNGLILQNSSSRPLLYRQEPGWRNGTVAGPVAIFPQSINRQRSANLQAEGDARLSAETMSMNCTMAVDPRVRFVKYEPPYFTEILDNAGNTIYSQRDRVPRLNDTDARNITVLTFSTSFQIPEKRGTKITSAKGIVHFLALVSEEHVEVADIEKKVSESFDVGSSVIRITRATVDNVNNNISLSLELRAKPSAPVAPAAQGLPEIRISAQPTPINFVLIDSTNREIYNSTLRGSMGMSIGGTFTGPFKLRFSVPTRTKEV